MLAATIINGQSTVKERQRNEADTLLEAVVNGDRVAYERLFRLFHDKVYRFAFRMLRDGALADEVTSDTLFTVWTDAGRFRGQSSVSSWILGIACNKSLKALRTRKRHDLKTEAISDKDQLTGNSAFDDPGLRVEELHELQQVSTAISQLSQDHQAVVRLTSMGHSCAEIADIVGCPGNTVKTRMFHARIRLRSLLGMEAKTAQNMSGNEESKHHE